MPCSSPTFPRSLTTSSFLVGENSSFRTLKVDQVYDDRLNLGRVLGGLGGNVDVTIVIHGASLVTCPNTGVKQLARIAGVVESLLCRSHFFIADPVLLTARLLISKDSDSRAIKVVQGDDHRLW